MSDDTRDEIGALADKADNLHRASQLELPLALHVKMLSEYMKEIRDRLRAVYIKESGHNPWKGEP